MLCVLKGVDVEDAVRRRFPKDRFVFRKIISPVASIAVRELSERVCRVRERRGKERTFGVGDCKGERRIEICAYVFFVYRKDDIAADSVLCAERASDDDFAFSACIVFRRQFYHRLIGLFAHSAECTPCKLILPFGNDKVVISPSLQYDTVRRGKQRKIRGDLLRMDKFFQHGIRFGDERCVVKNSSFGRKTFLFDKSTV